MGGDQEEDDRDKEEVLPDGGHRRARTPAERLLSWHTGNFDSGGHYAGEGEKGDRVDAIMDRNRGNNSPTT